MGQAAAPKAYRESSSAAHAALRLLDRWPGWLLCRAVTVGFGGREDSEGEIFERREPRAAR